MEILIFRFVTWTLGNIVFMVYRNVCLQKFGLTYSISNTYKKWTKGKKHFYSIFMLMLSVTMAMAGAGGLFVLAAFLIGVSGIAVDFMSDRKNKYNTTRSEKFHTYGAIGGMAFGLLGLWVHYGMFILAIIGAVVCLGIWISKIKNHTYWSELAAFRFISYGILIDIIR